MLRTYSAAWKMFFHRLTSKNKYKKGHVLLPYNAKYLVIDSSVKIDETLKEYEYLLIDASVLSEQKNIAEFLEKIRGYMAFDARLLITSFVPWAVKLKNFFSFLTFSHCSLLTPNTIEHFFKLSGYQVVTKHYGSLLPFYVPLFSAGINLIGQLPLIRSGALRRHLVICKDRQAQNDLSVSVIIPCKNEKGSIEKAVNEVPEMGRGTEIVFVEGNSIDGTFEEIERVQKQYPARSIKVFKQDGKGKKDAVLKGFSYATGDVFMILDSDLTVEASSLPHFYKAIKQGRGEFLNGSRLVYPMDNKAMEWPAFFANHGIGICLSWLFNQKVKDTLCGTKVFLKKDYKKIIQASREFGQFDPFGDFDLLFGAAYNNLKITDVPVRYKNRGYGVSQISRYKQVWYLIAMGLVGVKKFKLRFFK